MRYDYLEAYANADANYKPGNYCTINQNLTLVRWVPNGDFMCRLPAGVKLRIRGTTYRNTDSYTWVMVQWGEVPTEIMYIRGDAVTATSEAPYDYKSAIISIADSMKDKSINGNEIGTYGIYCQNYLYWLCRAAGMKHTSENIPYHLGITGDALQWFQGKTRYTAVNSTSTYAPALGDWIYYRNNGSSDTASHVGLVVEVSGYKVRTVEGNLSGMINGVPMFDYRNGLSDKYVIGFASPIYQ